MLKLKVFRCDTPTTIASARIDVQVTRGGNQVYSATGYTDVSGYVQFSFANLQVNDEAAVTVTPSGEQADSDHRYLYVWSESRQSNAWEIGGAGGLCPDAWYDEPNEIIQTTYHT